MSREYPDWVNPWKAAEGRRIFSGTMPLGRMSRLRTLLADSAGEAVFTASFGLDAQQRVVIELEVEAELPLTCQATLEVYRQPVARRSVLAVIAEEAEQDLLPEDYEPVCPESGRLVLAGMVEDELLLAMPQVPRKPGLEGVTFSTDPQERREALLAAQGLQRPFAGLKKLLGESREDRESE